MTTHQRTELRGALLALMAVVMLLAPPRPAAAAGASLGAEATKAVPARPGQPPAHLAPYPWPYFGGACLRFGACGAWAWNDRQAPRRPVAPDAPAPVEQDIWGSAGSPWGYVRRLPPPTPEKHIQPRYKDASTIRPEFEEASGGGTPR
jgi:hypothetical protein